MITFTRDWRGYAKGSSIGTLAATLEAVAVAEGAATYGGIAGPLNSGLDRYGNVSSLVDGGGKKYSAIGAIRDYADLVQAIADTASASSPVQFEAVPGSTITLEAPVSINTATLGINFNGATIQAGNITGNNKAITLGYSPSDFTAWRKYAQGPMVLEKFYLIGPGRNAAANVDGGNGTVGIYTQGTVGAPSNRAVRPTVRDFLVSSFDAGFVCNDVSFLGQITNPTIYDCRVGWRQQAATDSGENYRIFGGITQRCELGWLLEDGSSEWFVYGHSVDYGIQLALLRPSASWARLGFTDCHIETRGSELGSDAGWYVSQGTGADSRCVVPSRDSFIDVNGTGSMVYFHGGLVDLNSSGTAPAPWAHSQLINVRHKNSGVYFRDCSPQTLQNTANLLATGPGFVKHEGGQLMFPSALTVPARLQDNPITNRLYDYAFPTAQIRDLWTIRRDTAEITDRFTGTNGSLARDNSATRPITIVPALTMSGTGTGTRTVTSNSGLPAFSPMMVGRNFVVGSGVGSITSVDSESQITINVTVAFASTAITAGSAVARNTASLRVTKVGAAGTNFEAACLIPCSPGERITVHGYYWVPAFGGVTSIPAVNTRWAKRGMPKVTALAGTAAAAYLATVPTEGYADTAGSDWDIGAARDTAVIRTTDLAITPTNTWIEFVLTVPNDTQSTSNGAMQCPEWADCMEFVVNLNGAGAGNIFFTDLWVSAW